MNRLENIIVSDISEITTVYSQKGRRYKTENRYCFGLSFCQSGKIIYTINNRDIVSDKNSAVILPQYGAYHLYGAEDGFFPLINFSAIITEPINDIIHIPLTNPGFYIHEFTRLKQNMLFDHSRLENIQILYGLLNNLSGETRKLHPAVKAALNCIEERFFDSSLSNEEIAKAAGISEVYMRKLFTSELNSTPKQHIIDIRIKKSKQLLRETTAPIGSIAEQCGFTNAYHFCRTFKSAVNMTPSQYRLSSYAAKGHFLI